MQSAVRELCLLYSGGREISQKHDSDTGSEVPTKYGDHSGNPEKRVSNVEGMTHKAVRPGLKQMLRFLAGKCQRKPSASRNAYRPPEGRQRGGIKQGAKRYSNETGVPGFEDRKNLQTGSHNSKNCGEAHQDVYATGHKVTSEGPGETGKADHHQQEQCDAPGFH